ncbi:MAG: hypothetical protein F7C07_05215 [Desulfurococcales archaeon]|nr:hypothetical protein [Desulfurococcales archaeon]
MATEREVFEAKKLEAKYGVIGKAAARYRMAGYNIEVVDDKEEAAANFVATKKGEKLAVKVFYRSGKVPQDAVEKLIEYSGKASARPVLVLYGSGPKITGELLDLIRSNNVSLRRMRS